MTRAAEALASCFVTGPETVQTFEGHSSLQVTMDRYGHLLKSDDHKEAIDMIAAVLLLAAIKVGLSVSSVNLVKLNVHAAGKGNALKPRDAGSGQGALGKRPGGR